MHSYNYHGEYFYGTVNHQSYFQAWPLLKHFSIKSRNGLRDNLTQKHRTKAPRRLSINHILELELCPFHNPLSTNPTEWPNTFKQFIGFCRRIV